MVTRKVVGRTKPPPRWGQERRLEFIDFRLLWDRTVNRSEIVDFFRISTQQASADLSVYMELAPKNLEYDKNLKTYRATPAFKPLMTRSDAQAFLDQLTALAAGTLISSASFLGWRPPYDFVRLPRRPIPTDLLLRILWAIRDREEMQITYQSMRRSAPMLLWISPHAFAHDGIRWHVRAWSHENEAYRDFVISRVQGIRATRKTNISADTDKWWHTYVEIIVKAKTGLTEAQSAAIEADYGMKAHRLVIKCRKALAFYVLRQLQLHLSLEDPHIYQPLELVNRNELSDVIAAAVKLPTSNKYLSRRTQLETTHE